MFRFLFFHFLIIFIIFYFLKFHSFSALFFFFQNVTKFRWRGLTLQYCEVDVTKKPNNVSWKAFFVDNLVFYSLILFTEYKSSKDRDRNMEDVRKNLTGKNMKVELYDATESIPDDKFLNQFDTIVLISFNSFFNEQNLLGDRVVRTKLRK